MHKTIIVPPDYYHPLVSLERPTLGTRLKALRDEHQLSLRELAKKCSISSSTLDRYENGIFCPRVSDLVKIGAVYGLTARKILKGVEL